MYWAECSECPGVPYLKRLFIIGDHACHCKKVTPISFYENYLFQVFLYRSALLRMPVVQCLSVPTIARSVINVMSDSFGFYLIVKVRCPDEKP